MYSEGGMDCAKYEILPGCHLWTSPKIERVLYSFIHQRIKLSIELMHTKTSQIKSHFNSDTLNVKYMHNHFPSNFVQLLQNLRKGLISESDQKCMFVKIIFH